MGKKKLSALELTMKKMAVLANDKFATKADAAKTLLDSLGLSVVDGQVCQTYNT